MTRSREATKRAAPKMSRAAVPPPDKSIEQQGAAAALSRIASAASTVPPDCRIVESHISKLEQALAAEQRAHVENVQALKDFHETETARLEADHKAELDEKIEQLTRTTAELERANRSLETVRLKNLAAQRELGSIDQYRPSTLTT